MRDTPASSFRAAAAAMRGVVVYKRKFHTKLRHKGKEGGGSRGGTRVEHSKKK